MCEFSGKLVAWLDRELPAGKASEVAQHLRECGDCRTELAMYEHTSAAFDTYLDAVVARNVRHVLPRWWVPAVGAVAAVIAAVVVLAFWSPRSAQQPAVPLPLSVAAVVPPVQSASAPLSVAGNRIPRKRVVSTGPASAQDESTFLPAEPVVRITIPAEEIFPPGAVPAGVSINADLTIGPDGSVQWILLRP